MGRWWCLFALLGCQNEGGETACPDSGCPVPLPEVRQVQLTGACPVAGGVRLDVVLAEDDRGITLTHFERAGLLPPTTREFQFSNVRLEPTEGAAQSPTLTARSVAFRGPTQPALVVLVLDQSASLVGLDAEAGTRDTLRASDPSGLRFSFFSSLINGLPSDVALALLSFRGLFGQVNPTYAAPTLDRGILRSGLLALDGEEGGATPLARGLIDALEKVIEVHPEFGASVVLFTDGVEDGDTSNLPDRADPSDLASALTAYQAAGVPVHVVQLQPPEAAGTPRARDAALADFACKTGGSWTLVATPMGLDDTLRATLTRRLAGAWQVEAAAEIAGDAELVVGVEVLGRGGVGRPWIYWTATD